MFNIRIYGKLTSRRRTESYVTKTPSSIKIKTPLTNSPVMGINRPNDNLRASYNDFYKDAFEEKGEKTGFKSLFNQQIEDERTRFRNTLSPFLSYSARNFSYFSKSN